MAAALKTAKTFAKDQNGTIAMMFGLMFMAFAMVAGMAIDYGRVHHMNTRLTAATDAAALAAGSALLDGRLSDTEIEDMARTFFDRNLNDGPGLFGTVSTPTITVDRGSRSVLIDSVANVPMTITKIAGFSHVDVPVRSATQFDQRDIELGMALDVTGSMRGSKIQALKVAAKDLLDILMPDSGNANRVRVGLAPYAASINAGTFANTVTGHTGGGHTCVHERTGADRFTDAAPANSLTYLGRRNSMNCPSATIVPLSDNKAALKAEINSYNASGATAGHLGAAWAGYMVSPEWNTIWPTASRPVGYGDSNTIKAVILMTDGVFNTQYESGNGNSAAQARAVCDEMKNKGVAVYSVAFQAPGSAQALLADCSSGSSHYFSADNDDELRQAFQKIAKQLNNLRLTN